MNSNAARRSLACLTALAMLAAACGSDGETATESSTSTEAAASSTGPPDTGGTTSTTTPADTTPELTASYRGVTEDSIKIGIVLFDLDAILDLGVDVGYGDQEAHFQLAIDAVNESGGILGRRIEPVYRIISPVVTADSDVACVEFTEDEMVFLAMGVLRPAENVLCYTALGDTPFIGGVANPTDAVFVDSVVPLLFAGKTPARSDEAILIAMEEEGDLEGEIIGLHGSDTVRLDRFEEELLARGAAGVVQSVEQASEADQFALAAELDIMVSRFDADGVTVAINTENNVAYLAAFERAGYAVPVYSTSPDVLVDFIYDQGATEAEVSLVKLIGSPTPDDLYLDGHEPTVECVDRWNEARPDEPAKPNADQDAGDFLNIGVIVASCIYVDLLVLAATAAGADLTVDSFTAALDDVGSFEAAGLPFASLSSTKWDANDTATLSKWDEDEGAIVHVSFIDLA